MELKYTVTSCSEDPIDVIATVPGIGEVSAKIMGLVVEVVSEDGSMGHTLRLTPTDMAEAKELFTVGNKVTATFALAE
jgi:ABC-type Zn uptake system ZnuABC Zn-binding protein ZnuA